VHGARQVPERWTFYIDKEGTIRHIDKQVNVAKHGEDIVRKVKELKLTE
jgi:peroxiredoxin Q/BCP